MNLVYYTVKIRIVFHKIKTYTASRFENETSFISIFILPISTIAELLQLQLVNAFGVGLEGLGVLERLLYAAAVRELVAVFRYGIRGVVSAAGGGDGQCGRAEPMDGSGDAKAQAPIRGS